MTGKISSSCRYHRKLFNADIANSFKCENIIRTPLLFPSGLGSRYELQAQFNTYNF